MKCSKCGYLGFETGDRCRNCGYEFWLAADCDLSDLPIRDEPEPSHLDDFALVDAALARAPRPAASASTFTGSGVSTSSAVLAPPPPVVRGTPSAMPLFAPGI